MSLAAKAAANAPTLLVFRDDLRLHDNPALVAAVEAGRPVLALFVLDEVSPSVRPLGGASRWWLDGSLRRLHESLVARGGGLHLAKGPMASTVLAWANAAGAACVMWNRRTDAAQISADTLMKQRLKAEGRQTASFNAHLLYEPWTITTGAGEPYRVFTPFWKACRASGPPPAPTTAPAELTWFDSASCPLPGASDPSGSPALGADFAATLDAWSLTPRAPDWAGGLREAWTPGEAASKAKLEAFVSGAMQSYKTERDRPDRESTSQLSPYLRFGELSPRLAYARALDEAAARGWDTGAQKFLSELGWREFSYSLLFHHRDLATVNVQSRFDAFPWRDDAAAFHAWTRGQTGYPLVDAGMRELYQTGWMHNRVRMVAASFLIKHLMIDWRRGEEWFWDTLVDADPANNPASWQWVAGSGADAAPYFRIFNPFLQGETHDKTGAYVRRWVPELAKLPVGVLNRPWTADAQTLRAANVTLGETYPHPIVDHAEARDRALAGFQSLKASA